MTKQNKTFENKIIKFNTLKTLRLQDFKTKLPQLKSFELIKILTILLKQDLIEKLPTMDNI